MGEIEAKLETLGHRLPAVPEPAGAYIPAVRTGNHVYTSGQVPFEDGELASSGKVGAEVSLEEAQAAARTCVLNALAALRAELGSLDRVARIVKLTVFVASAEGFNDQARVANGASELLGEIFGERGAHARSAVGVFELPLGAPVEVEVIAEIG